MADLLGGPQKVLDMGYVKFIDSMGTDETIIEAARMSTGRGFEGWDKDSKLLEYLYAHHHMTPFEMCELVIEVQAPIFVFREWHRHRTQSYNEFSARYSVMPNLHYVPQLDRVQMQAKHNKQGSSEALPEYDAGKFVGRLQAQQQEIYQEYEEALELGMSKEVARINTPVSRYSKMRAKGNLRNWLGFLMLRCDKTAQWEIRQYADVVAKIVGGIWPRTFELFLEHDFLATKFSRNEMRILHDVLAGTDFVGRIAKYATDGLGEKKAQALIEKFTRSREEEYGHLVSR